MDTQIKSIIMVVFALIATILLISAVGYNDEQEWTFAQTIFGQTKVVNTTGPFWKLWGKTYSYPRYHEIEFSKEATEKSPTDESIRVTFNDGGTADMSSVIRIITPVTEEEQRKFHRQFGGSIEGIENAVWAHLSNCIKATGPLMSGSEHQSSRKAEFTQLVQDQLEDGLYAMRRIERILKDQTDEKGNPITVFATELLLEKDATRPQVSQLSPLLDYNIKIAQFSITESEYDDATRKQFEQKKNAFLAAERAKAQREEEVQQRLMIEEKGRREKAEYEAAAFKEKAKQVIEAQRESEVQNINANREKAVAEIQAQRQFEVATLEKKTAETNAAKVLEVAKLEKLAADQNAAKIIALANAEQERIRLGGAITEEKRVLAEIERDTKIGVAEKLSGVNVPGIIVSGGGDGAGQDTQSNLINMFLLRQLGVLPEIGKQQ